MVPQLTIFTKMIYMKSVLNFVLCSGIVFVVIRGSRSNHDHFYFSSQLEKFEPSNGDLAMEFLGPASYSYLFLSCLLFVIVNQRKFSTKNEL